MSQFKPGNGSKPVTPRRPSMRPPVQDRRPTSVVLPATQANNEAPQTEEDVPRSGAQSAALYSTAIFIFFRFSYLHEFLTTKTGIDTHVLLIVGAAAVLSGILAGGIFRGFTSKIALAWFGFVTCMVLATAVSTWKGGSFEVLFPYLRTTFLLFILIQGATFSPKDLFTLLKSVGLAGLATVMLGLFISDFRYGRLEMTGAGGSIQDSNDYAALVILVMPAIAYFTMRKGAPAFLKPVGVLALGAGCFLVLSTGSRGALISLMVSTLYVLFVGSGKARAAILVGVPLLALVSIPLLPGESAERLATLFNSKGQVGEAAASQMQRTELLMDSIKFTAQHPLLGVGPGTFSIFQAQDAANKGERGMWHETHNAYTQISSECGVPAVIFYLTAVILTFIVFRRGRKSSSPDIRAAAQILGLMLVAFSVCLCFLSQGYGFGFPVLGGFAISMERILRSEAEQTSAETETLPVLAPA